LHPLLRRKSWLKGRKRDIIPAWKRGNGNVRKPEKFISIILEKLILRINFGVPKDF
jgi:hypothetical protein